MDMTRMMAIEGGGSFVTLALALAAGDTERFIGLGPSCRVKEGELALAPGQSHELAFQVKVEARN